MGRLGVGRRNPRNRAFTRKWAVLLTLRPLGNGRFSLLLVAGEVTQASLGLWRPRVVAPAARLLVIRGSVP